MGKKFRIEYFLPLEPFSFLGNQLKIKITNISDSTTSATNLLMEENSLYYSAKAKIVKLEPGASVRIDLEGSVRGMPAVLDIPEYHVFTIDGEITRIKTCAWAYTGVIREMIPKTAEYNGKYKILLFGIAGSGKSSFINGVHTLFTKGYSICHDAAQAGGTDSHCTKAVTYHDVDTEDSGNLPLQLVDVWGLDLETYRRSEVLKALCEGLMPVTGYTMDHNIRALKDSPMIARIQETAPSRMIHAVLFFVRYGDLGNENLMQAVEKNFKDLGDLGYNPLVIVSRIDEVDKNALVHPSSVKFRIRNYVRPHHR